MTINYIDEIDIAEKPVFLRLDLNVPIDLNGNVGDDTRIRAALPTIKYALEQKAKLVLASHLGRPKGEINPKFSLKPVAIKLSELLEMDIIFPEDCIGDAVRKLVGDLRPGAVILLENLRFHKEETANDAVFSERLANLCEVYINDAFGTAHRAHASTAGITKYVKTKGAGFLIKKEVKCLDKLLTSPEKPYITIIGGAKVSDKIGVIDRLLDKVDSVLIGGGMAYTFLKAQGKDIGNSLHEDDKIHTAKKILTRAATRGVDFLLPVDHVVAGKLSADAKYSNTKDANIPDGLMGLDIGPKTIELYSEKIAKASTIFWNGPMGVCETKPFEEGTFKLASAIADSGSMSVVGGGDSIAAINASGLSDKFSHICTGGGASLEFLEGRKLPGLVALEQ